MPRERLGSRLGFILLSAGCAIGVGNVWKFPGMVGQDGGGAFVVCYVPVSYTHLDVYKRQGLRNRLFYAGHRSGNAE